MKHPQWPALPYEAWKDTYETLHMWMQIVGKIRLARMPWLNHCWQVTFYPTARGLTTGPMPYGDRHRDHRNTTPLADFYRAVMEALTALGMPVHIYRRPAEVESKTPFDVDE